MLLQRTGLANYLEISCDMSPFGRYLGIVPCNKGRMVRPMNPSGAHLETSSLVITIYEDLDIADYYLCRRDHRLISNQLAIRAHHQSQGWLLIDITMVTVYYVNIPASIPNRNQEKEIANYKEDRCPATSNMQP